MEEEFESAKRTMGESILLNSFEVNRKSLVVTDASGDGFGHIMKKEDNVWAMRNKAARKTGEVTNDTG